MPNRSILLSFALLLGVPVAAAQETVTHSPGLSVDVGPDGRFVIDVAGDLWLVPPGGGQARPLGLASSSARRPRWSPQGDRIAFLAVDEGTQVIRVLDLERGATEDVTPPGRFDLAPAWHPSGERLVYASDHTGHGFDLWETDLATGLHWRLTDRPGDELDAAWSTSGRDLVYVHHDGAQWSLVLRPFGEPEEILVTDTRRIAAPSWRPDGSLIAYFTDSGERVALNIVILSQPRLAREYANSEQYVLAPVSWPDRQHMVFASGGTIRLRPFDAWASRMIPFRARLTDAPVKPAERVRRELPMIDPPAGRLVVRAARLWDGIDSNYAPNRDIVIDGGRITAIEDRADRPGVIVIDMGDLAVVPGFVDVASRLPEDGNETVGPLLLATGLTTLVAEREDAGHLDRVWSGKAMPGPRLLPADEWSVESYSGLADAGTPGLDKLLGWRQADLIGVEDPVARRFSEAPRLDRGVTSIVLGSRPSGLPAGVGLQAELRALVAAGLRPEQAMRAAGVNAAAALGVDPALGRIAIGAVADLVFIDGDPLRDISHLANVVAVVRNGRFYSVAGLIERAAAPAVSENLTN